MQLFSQCPVHYGTALEAASAFGVEECVQGVLEEQEGFSNSLEPVELHVSCRTIDRQYYGTLAAMGILTYQGNAEGTEDQDYQRAHHSMT
jgi:hypothetical protein